MTVQDSTEPGELADLSCDFVHVYAPAPAVVVLPARASPAIVSALRHAHQMCHDFDVLLSVVTPNASVRRILRSPAPGRGAELVVHAHTDTAIAAATAAGR